MNNKIFFWTNYYIENPEIGTTVKIHSEINTLRRMGYIVYYTAYISGGVAIYDDCDNIVIKKKISIENKLLFKYLRERKLVDIGTIFVRENVFDFCLLRINVLNYHYMHMLKEMKKHSVVMMESLSYFPHMKFSDVKGFGYYFLLASIKLNSKRLKNYIDLMLTEGYIDNFYGIPCIEFGMGVDVKNINPHKYVGNKNELHLLMVGCKSVYHGTDRIIRSVEDFYGENSEPEMPVYLHLVGDLFENDSKLIESCKYKDKIIVYGSLFGEKLDAVYNECNVALGPLAQHRLKKKDTGLKTKEYFAKGIPYIYSGEEVRIEENYQYILKIEDSENDIEIKDIIEFWKKVREDKNVVENMRKRAREVFSWEEIFTSVFSKVTELR